MRDRSGGAVPGAVSAEMLGGGREGWRQPGAVGAA